VGHYCYKKNNWPSSGSLITNPPADFLFGYTHGRTNGDVLFDDFKEVVRHGNDVALLSYEQLKLLAQFRGYVCLDLGCAFLPSHEETPTGQGGENPAGGKAHAPVL
jgi:hypothetical protein